VEEAFYQSKLFATLAGIVVGAFLSLFIERLRLRIYRPILAIEFNLDTGCICDTPIRFTQKEFHEAGGQRDVVTMGKAKAIRFVVINESKWVADDCQSYLTLIEKKQEDGRFIPLLDETLPLKWSYLDTGPQKFTAHFKLYCDLVAANDHAPGMKLSSYNPLRWLTIGNVPGVYRFTVNVTATNALPISKQIYVRWSGSFDTMIGSLHNEF
jgi:hypothetical protein